MRGRSVVHGYYVERTLESVLAEVRVLLGRPRWTAREVVGRTRPR